jgi:hypothetical protein
MTLKTISDLLLEQSCLFIDHEGHQIGLQLNKGVNLSPLTITTHIVYPNGDRERMQENVELTTDFNREIEVLIASHKRYIESKATAYNWLNFYSFHYQQFWRELNTPEYDWTLKANAVLISRRQKTLTQARGSIAAPCCLVNTGNTENEEFWAQDATIILRQRPSVYLLEKWTQVECPYLDDKSKKLIPPESVSR